MLAGLLLALIGVADIVRARSRRRGRKSERATTVIAVTVLWVAASVVAWRGLGITPWAVAVILVAAGLWVATTTAIGAGSAEPEPGREPEPVRQSGPEWEPGTQAGRPSHGRARPSLLRRSGSWPSLFLAAVVVVLVLAEPQITSAPSGFVVDWHRDSGLAFVGRLPLAALLCGLGSALFLIDSANIVVTSALPSGMGSSGEAEGGVGVPEADVEVALPWWRRRRTRRLTAPAVREVPTRELKGGRLIGPIERLLLAGFALTGAFPVVAALIAAKGIVRFPEINRATTGNPAEYFLIGSLVSWATAFGLAGLCWVLALA